MENYQDNKELEKQKQWEREKIIYFGQILGIIQIVLTIVASVLIGTVMYLYNNFLISHFFQSVVAINIVIVLAISFVALVVIFIIMYLKILISVIYAIKEAEERFEKMIFVKILLLPAFFTFYYRNAFRPGHKKNIKNMKNNEKKDKINTSRDLDNLENEKSII